MKKIVVMGHGGYAKGVKENLEMIVGESQHMYYFDLTKDDDLADLENRVNALIESFDDDDEVLFACDLLGASPFRVAATICVNHPQKYYAVAGLNAMALIELSMESDLSIEELANHAIETTKTTTAKFPE